MIRSYFKQFVWLRNEGNKIDKNIFVIDRTEKKKN